MSGKKSASDDAALTVLYDGRALAHAPGSPAAAHLLALLAILPPTISAVVALPGPSPHALPSRAEALLYPAGNNPLNWLHWEQNVLPALARQSAAGLIHLFSANAPLTAPVAVMISPAEIAPPAPRRGLAARWRESLAYGAASRVRAVLWPEDLPMPAGGSEIQLLPPLVHPVFGEPAAWQSHLPDGYVLVLGAHQGPELELLVEGWKWAGPAVGETCPLVFGGLDSRQQDALSRLTRGWDLEQTLRFFPADRLPDRAALLGQATAVVCPGDPPPWGDPLLEALAAAKPIVAPETGPIAARVGPAAYLFARRDARALGAALTTLVVQEDVAEKLSTAARHRAEGWNSAQFAARLEAIYRRMVRT